MVDDGQPTRRPDERPKTWWDDLNTRERICAGAVVVFFILLGLMIYFIFGH